MSALDVDRIEQLATAATPGEWHAHSAAEILTDGRAVCHDVEDEGGVYHGEVVCDRSINPADAAFIAGLDPPTALALVAEIRRLRALLSDDWDAYMAESMRDPEFAVSYFAAEKAYASSMAADLEDARAELVLVETRNHNALNLHAKNLHRGDGVACCLECCEAAIEWIPHVSWPCATAAALTATTPTGELE